MLCNNWTEVLYAVSAISYKNKVYMLLQNNTHREIKTLLVFTFQIHRPAPKFMQNKIIKIKNTLHCEQYLQLQKTKII